MCRQNNKKVPGSNLLVETPYNNNYYTLHSHPKGHSLVHHGRSPWSNIWLRMLDNIWFFLVLDLMLRRRLAAGSSCCLFAQRKKTAEKILKKEKNEAWQKNTGKIPGKGIAIGSFWLNCCLQSKGTGQHTFGEHRLLVLLFLFLLLLLILLF